MANSEKEGGQCSVKKVYELVLSAREVSQQLGGALEHLIKLSLHSHDHFSFLLHRVNWFEPPLTHYRSQFLRICRLYRPTSRQSARVVHNLVIEGFFGGKSHCSALECLSEMLSEGCEQRAILSALRQNYPHKLCPIDIHTFYLRNLLTLCRTFKKYRADLLETIVESLVKFDTEVVLGDQEVHCPFPSDRKCVDLRKQAANNELALKLDILMVELLEYLGELPEDEAILDQILLVFQNKVLPIKTTKNIQFIVFFVAESNRTRAKSFISFLLANIFDRQEHKENWYRIFAQSNFYLSSYLLRSKAVTPKIITKTLLLMISRLHSRLLELEDQPINGNTHLKHLMQSIELPLLVLQTIIMIVLEHRALDNQEVSEAFHSLLAKATPKLHFHYFLNEKVLAKLSLPSHRSNPLRLKFSNKFLPSTLPKTGVMMDQLMMLGEMEEEQPEGSQEGPRKIVKGETPISYCSETVV